MEEKYMKIVVIGALGHIGSRLIRNLPNEFPNAEIVMIDNMKTQRYPSLFNLPKNGDYQFIEDDVTTMELMPVMSNANAVIHLAALTDAAGSFGQAEEVERVNFTATEVVAKACLEAGVPIIHSSSTSVYGTQNDVVDEDCSEDELQPQSPYAETKLKEENLIAQLSIEKGLRASSCRFGTIFGASPGMRFHTAVNKFCWQATIGQPITVWRTAYDQKRPYLDLVDASRAIAFIIQNDLFDGRIYNVLTHNSTVRQVVDTIREFVPELEIEFVESKIMNQLSYEVLCDKILSEGFIFTGNLRRGIGETISLLR